MNDNIENEDSSDSQSQDIFFDSKENLKEDL